MATGFNTTHHPRQAHDKWVYDHEAARGEPAEHAMHFRTNRQRQARDLRGAMDRRR